jgi:hypothetical protein
VIGGWFVLNSGCWGIGFGVSGAVESVRIESGVFDCNAVEGACLSWDWVRLGEGLTTVITGQRSFVSGDSWNISEKAHLYFEYVTSSVREGNLTKPPFVHVRAIGRPYPDVYGLRIQSADTERNFEVIFNGTGSQGCGFSVGEIGDYSMWFTSAGTGVFGRLEHNGSSLFDACSRGDNFFPDADYVLLPNCTLTKAPRTLLPPGTMSPPGTPLSTTAPGAPAASGGANFTWVWIAVPLIVIGLVGVVLAIICRCRLRESHKAVKQSLQGSAVEEEEVRVITGKPLVWS